MITCIYVSICICICFFIHIQGHKEALGGWNAANIMETSCVMLSMSFIYLYLRQ